MVLKYLARGVWGFAFEGKTFVYVQNAADCTVWRTRTGVEMLGEPTAYPTVLQWQNDHALQVAAWDTVAPMLFEEIIKRQIPGPTIPEPVATIALMRKITIQKAWRLYRGLTQTEVAARCGMLQSSLSEIEKVGKLRRKTAQKLAAIYKCDLTQIWS